MSILCGLGICIKLPYGKKRFFFFNAQMKESSIKEPTKRLGNTDSKTSKF